MNQEEKLKKYCDKNLLQVEIEEGVLYIQDKYYEIVDSDVPLFNSDFEFYPILIDDTIDGHVYEFGGHWYLQNYEEEVSMQKLIYLGDAFQKLPTPTFLGIHSGHEMLNGVGMYEDWIKKAKFLGVTTLGICEKNSLIGALDFQTQCKKNGIKSIIGMSLSTKNNNSSYSTKLYAKDFQGWQNLLKFSEKINVHQEIAVEEKFLLENLEGLSVVIDPKTTPFENRPKVKTYYQIDTAIYSNEEADDKYINNLEKYLKSNLKPILIIDAYYPNQEDWQAREILWGIGKRFDLKSENQFFKNNDQFAKELMVMFEKENTSWIKLYKESVSNLQKLVDSCNFKYDTENRRLPEYEMTKEEIEKYGDKRTLFLHLIKLGLKERKIGNSPIYMKRLQKEMAILIKGDVLDYFLIQWDIIKAAKKDDILVGIARGSAGGSLVSYLLGIIQLNPIEFNLLFERFLNPGRIGEMTECKAYEIETNDGQKIVLNIGSLLKVLRMSKEMFIFVEDLRVDDEILEY